MSAWPSPAGAGLQFKDEAIGASPRGALAELQLDAGSPVVQLDDKAAKKVDPEAEVDKFALSVWQTWDRVYTTLHLAVADTKNWLDVPNLPSSAGSGFWEAAIKDVGKALISKIPVVGLAARGIYAGTYGALGSMKAMKSWNGDLAKAKFISRALQAVDNGQSAEKKYWNAAGPGATNLKATLATFQANGHEQEFLEQLEDEAKAFNKVVVKLNDFKQVFLLQWINSNAGTRKKTWGPGSDRTGTLEVEYYCEDGKVSLHSATLKGPGMEGAKQALDEIQQTVSNPWEMKINKAVGLREPKKRYSWSMYGPDNSGVKQGFTGWLHDSSLWKEYVKSNIDALPLTWGQIKTSS